MENGWLTYTTSARSLPIIEGLHIEKNAEPSYRVSIERHLANNKSDAFHAKSSIEFAPYCLMFPHATLWIVAMSTNKS